MAADIINLLNSVNRKVKELSADRDACLARAKRAEEKVATMRADHEREAGKLRGERDKLLRLLEQSGVGL